MLRAQVPLHPGGPPACIFDCTPAYVDALHITNLLSLIVGITFALAALWKHFK